MDSSIGHTRLNYRGDLSATLSGGSLGDAQGTAFAALRFGQGAGVTLRPTYTSTVNSTAFESAGGSEETYAIVAQAWYQLTWALNDGGFNTQGGNRVELTAGKIDFFGFFDQNAVAGDEAGQFLNNAFVHNPLLDSGGDTAADAYGLAPGIRVGYFNVGDGSLTWGASFGVFASGSGSAFNGGLGKPLVIAQFEVSPVQINGDPRGTSRVYAWTNGHTSDLAGAEQRHSGIGLSANQQLGGEWNLFGRWGRRKFNCFPENLPFQTIAAGTAPSPSFSATLRAMWRSVPSMYVPVPAAGSATVTSLDARPRGRSNRSGLRSTSSTSRTIAPTTSGGV